LIFNNFSGHKEKCIFVIISENRWSKNTYLKYYGKESRSEDEGSFENNDISTTNIPASNNI
jgi:hypothetical protein